MTIDAAKIIDPAYAETMNVAMNYYFIFVSVFVLTLAGSFVTERIVEPRLGSYSGEYKEELKGLDPVENRIKHIGNKLPHPVTLFAILALLVLILSAIVSQFGIRVEHPGEPGTYIEVKNLLNKEGIRYLFL